MDIFGKSDVTRETSEKLILKLKSNGASIIVSLYWGHPFYIEEVVEYKRGGIFLG